MRTLICSIDGPRLGGIKLQYSALLIVMMSFFPQKIEVEVVSYFKQIYSKAGGTSLFFKVVFGTP